MLDEFSSTKIDEKPAPKVPSSAPTTTSTTAPESSGPGRPNVTAEASTSAEDELAKEIQAGMADMLRELETNPDMAKQFEAMLSQFGAAAAAAAPSPAPQASKAKAPEPSSSQASAGAKPSAASASLKASGDAFQDTIRKTMNRMKESSSSADAAASSGPPNEDDMMATLLTELQAANGGAEGEGDDTFSKMLLGMMEQLTNKEILYEPMKELDGKFPAWLDEHGAGLEEEDKARYNKQRGLVRDIVERFERSGYSDGNAEDREYIVEKMQEVDLALKQVVYGMLTFTS